MDEQANLREQSELAQSILTTWDNCADDGTFSPEQLDSLAHDAHRLAELVSALAEFRQRRA